MTPVIFFDLFDRPIRPDTLYRLTYRCRLTPTDFERELDELELAGKIVRHHGFVRLADRKGLASVGLVREQHSRELWHEARTIINRLGCVPFIRMIAVINSLSFWNAHKNSDIDLLIVTEPGRIPVVRDHVNALLELWGKRNTRGPKRGKVAPDIFIDTEALDLRPFRLGRDDIYFDFWAARITPVLDRAGTYQRFLDANPWLVDTFPQFEPRTEHRIKVGPTREVRSKLWEAFYGTWPGHKLTAVIAERQQERLRRYQQRVGDKGLVVVSPHVLRFHVPDRRQEYQTQFESRWSHVAP